MLKLLKRLLVAIVVLVGLTIAIPVLGLAYGYLSTGEVEIGPFDPAADDAPSPVVAETLRTEIADYERTEESTFLTYPEWTIVYAAREYAAFVDQRFPSGFPYWAYVGRFWKDYALMIRATEPYPFNFQNHLMITVIGTSHTIEHALQWAYENTAGRLSEIASGWTPVPEDTYLADAASRYATFLDQTPWYIFDYAGTRAGLWDAETANGAATIRSWERKLAFGAALSVKQAYAGIIASGLSATSDPALLDINVWAAGPVQQAIDAEADTRLVRDLGADGAVFVTPRYQVFTDMIPRLIERGVRFVEIGGNRLIFLTVLSEDLVAAPPGASRIFDYAIPAMQDMRRSGFAVQVARLHEVLPALQAAGARLEHVYDY